MSDRRNNIHRVLPSGATAELKRGSFLFFERTQDSLRPTATTDPGVCLRSTVMK